ncbi:hypothetical protein ETAA8_57470 [Anatilimnocola aggregata]|uniref:Uncharacterized protein n=1 Tax=Anatilimnocola aggregata TaxID=2528021 RepID=A0A517YK48_9BACT|nr:hypothetical protein [Anatilimnocola aggregata]QDU30601.1 hypothetical protein ETAA8_57470 [Anatilimnocola aggregata]
MDTSKAYVMFVRQSDYGRSLLPVGFEPLDDFVPAIATACCRLTGKLDAAVTFEDLELLMAEFNSLWVDQAVTKESLAIAILDVVLEHGDDPHATRERIDERLRDSFRAN